ncbi:hypothetical protein, partial [Candidatus Oleimmundimicrobium sp.]|uniref:hypothetical protein n=1 Tax=Candidatus Oleimmundimicrobium sp. TaxID=3060597 RepID=UPI00271D2D47
MTCCNYHQVAECIENLTVRGAPAIGIAAAYGLVLASSEGIDLVRKAAVRLASTRPTAVNLFWAITRMTNLAERIKETAGMKKMLLEEANAILIEDINSNISIGKNGQGLLPPSCRVLS